MTHIIQSQDFSHSTLEQLFESTDRIEKMHKDEGAEERLEKLLKRKRIYLMFYQPSTRTILTFETAAKLLGAHVFKTDNAGFFSSAAKGETLEHTIRILCGNKADAIILRHQDEGAALRAVRVCEKYQFSTRIINAGDGTGQHPTQSLVDLYSIRKILGRLDNFTIAIGGDLAHGRTTHSLAYHLSKYTNVKIIFVSPPNFRMKSGILEHLQEHNVIYKETESKEDAFREADVVYWIRLQKEHLPKDFNSEQLMREYSINEAHMDLFKEKAFLLHPLPIDGEIDKEIDDHPKAKYFEQASYGISVRMALLCKMFNVEI